MTAFISLLGYVLIFYMVRQKDMEYLPSVILAGIVSSLYFMGLNGHLFLGARCLFWAGIIFFIISSYFLISRDNPRSLNVLSPGIVFFAMAFLVGYFVLQDAQYRNWDEFSHWGLASKEMLITNSLAMPDGAVQFLDYPPGINLFHYFTVLNSHMDREAGTYIGHLILLLAPLVIFFYRTRWRDWQKILLILLIVPFVIITLGNGFRSIYSDQLLSVYFAMIIVGYLYVEERLKWHILILLPLIFMLPMLKKTGYLLSWFAIAIFMTDQALSTWQMDKNNSPKSPTTERFKGLMIVGVLAMSAWFFEYTWGRRINALHLNETFSIPFDLKNTLAAFTDKAPDFTRQVIAKFKAKTISSFLDPANLLIGHIFFLSTILWARYKGQTRLYNRTIIVYLMLMAFLGIYAFGLLYMYLFSFTPDLAATLSSYDRYMNIFYAAFCLTGFGFFLLIDWKGLGYRRFLTFFLGLLALIGGLYWSFLQKPTPDYAQISQERKEIKQMVRLAKTVLNGRDRVYLVIQGDAKDDGGLKFRIMKYEFAPNVTQTWCWRMGGPKHKWDVCNCNKTPNEWSRALKNWDYVFVADSDPELWDRYGALFSDNITGHKGLLYKVTDKGGALVKLVPILSMGNKTYGKN